MEDCVDDGVVDTWFDIMTARPGKEQRESLIFGALEITLALLTFRFVQLVIVRSTTEKTIHLTTKRSDKRKK